MKGYLHKTEEGWFVIYDQRTMQDPSAEDGILPLHPEYQTILPLDLDLHGKEVEFDIIRYDGKTPISNFWNGYAKLIDKSDRSCNHTNCREVCPECIPYPVLDDCEEVKNWDNFVEKKNAELEVNQLAEISSELQEATYTPPHKITYKHGFVDGYNKAKETLYTEEQVRGAMDFARGLYANLFPKDVTDTQFIQSLKKD